MHGVPSHCKAADERICPPQTRADAGAFPFAGAKAWQQASVGRVADSLLPGQGLRPRALEAGPQQQLHWQ
eukprot:6173489-Pyramimonas_sp.AAC.1